MLDTIYENLARYDKLESRTRELRVATQDVPQDIAQWAEDTTPVRVPLKYRPTNIKSFKTTRIDIQSTIFAIILASLYQALSSTKFKSTYLPL